MSIELNREINLASEEVHSFLGDEARKTLPEDVSNAFDELKKEGLNAVDGTYKKISGRHEHQLICTDKYHYRRYFQQDREEIARFNVLVPVSHKVMIEMYTTLFISSKISDTNKRNQIIDAYNEFVIGENPLQYLAKKSEEIGISIEDVRVLTSYYITKISSPTITKAGKEIIQNAEQPAGKIETPNSKYNHVEGLHGYFYDNKIRTVLVSVEHGLPFGTPNKDNLHEKEVDDFNDDESIEGVINDVLKKESGVLDCNVNPKYLRNRISTLFNYPEFKTKLDFFWVRIGCVKTKIWYPAFYYRTSKVALYAYINYAKDIGDIAVNVIKDCAINSALTGSVIGIVSSNFALALAAFEALIMRCVKTKLIVNIPCLLPGLILITEKGRWNRI